MSVYDNVKCPYCHHVGLVLGEDNTKAKCPACGNILSGNVLRQVLLTSLDELKSAKPVKTLLSELPSIDLEIEISEDERKNLYIDAFTFDFICAWILYCFLSFFYSMSSIPWLTMFSLFLLSRLADYFSTIFSLFMGATETNPFSERHNINALMVPQIIQILSVVLISLFFGLFSPWLKIGWIFVYCSISFVSAIGNIGQVLIGPGMPPDDAYLYIKRRMITAHAFGIFIVGIAAFIILGILITYSGYIRLGIAFLFYCRKHYVCA